MSSAGSLSPRQFCIIQDVSRRITSPVLDDARGTRNSPAFLVRSAGHDRYTAFLRVSSFGSTLAPVRLSTGKATFFTSHAPNAVRAFYERTRLWSPKRFADHLTKENLCF